MIELKGVSIGYDNKLLLKNADAIFKDSQLIALIGRNGAGKSTLLKAICGLNHDYAGEIIINNHNLRNIPKNKLATYIAFVHTRRPHISNISCRDIVSLGRSPYTGWTGRLSSKDREAVDEALSKVGMENFADRKLDSLSDGECQKVMIARAIAQDTTNIILDEPTSFLDLPTRFELVNLLKDLAHEKKKTIVFSTHELDIALEMSDIITVIDHNSLVYGTTREIISKGCIQNLFSMPSDFIDRLLNMILGK